ncbi:MSMEG_1061 family FMN-dependent PPOX-type flavoprotein [Micromonospora echinospora]|uniref:MSMEG_1061 family FMN-dependent PPOX-type flavoprotein n=1 Tax=Micromonospora echinospora TaxID=1877 RepID=UPI003CE989DF
MDADRHPEYTEIASAAELRALLGEPNQLALTRERARLHEVDRQWLALSPLCVLATTDAQGRTAATLKGDPPGLLAHVLDDRTIVVPERPGNRRADGLFNVLSNPRIAVIFLIPGRSSALFINGRARVLRDAPFFDAMAVRGKRPILGLLVEIEEIFSNCPKALMRSGVWQPETWQPDALPSHATLLKALQDTPATLTELEERYAPENYSQRLY